VFGLFSTCVNIFPHSHKGLLFSVAFVFMLRNGDGKDWKNIENKEKNGSSRNKNEKKKLTLANSFLFT
jgi:hypothetical protein